MRSIQDYYKFAERTILEKVEGERLAEKMTSGLAVSGKQGSQAC